MDYVLFAWALAVPVGALRAYRCVINERALVKVAALLAASLQYALATIALLALFYGVAALWFPGTPQGRTGLLMGLVALTVLPAFMAYALHRYCVALWRARERAVPRAYVASLVVALTFTPILFGIAHAADSPACFLLGVPVLGLIWVFVGAARSAREAAEPEPAAPRPPP